jgi:hypothetical protein
MVISPYENQTHISIVEEKILMNIKRGMKRIWVVGSVLLVIGVVGLTIEEFPEKTTRFIDITESKDVKKKFTKKQKEVLNKVDQRIYEEKIKETLKIPLWGLGGLVFMWGLLYTGFWITSGFTGDKKKDETNE